LSDVIAVARRLERRRTDVGDQHPRHQARQRAPGLVRERRPDVVGMSVMTFQRPTALKIARLIRALRPEARIVVGGYDPSLAPDAYHACEEIDCVVRGEGEHTFCEVLRAWDRRDGLSGIAGLSYRTADGFVHNPERKLLVVMDDFHFFGSACDLGQRQIQTIPDLHQ
jgi:radical SAM superfamily enzyme YgiQ (UPF0313 family)